MANKDFKKILLKRGQPDFYFIFAVFILVGFGVVMVLSASLVTAFKMHGDSFYFLKRHLISVFLGMGAFFFALNFDYFKYRRWAFWFFIFSLVLLAAVYWPAISTRAGGASRWLKLGFISFQPSEVAKLAFVIFLADLIAHKKEKMKDFKNGLLPLIIMTLPVLGLIGKQPDLGTALVLAGVFFVLIFLGGARLKDILVVLIVAALLAGMVIAHYSYQQKRIQAFLDPWKDPEGAGFHAIQSLLAVGSGGVFGVGLGASRQKCAYLPLQFTDFIFAIICEELGFLGSLAIVFFFIFITVRGLRIARSGPDSFARLLAVGLTSWIIFQAAINIGVVLGLIPITGIPLSFISFGGTAVIMTLWAAGILANISRFRKKI